MKLRASHPITTDPESKMESVCCVEFKVSSPASIWGFPSSAPQFEYRRTCRKSASEEGPRKKYCRRLVCFAVYRHALPLLWNTRRQKTKMYPLPYYHREKTMSNSMPSFKFKDKDMLPTVEYIDLTESKITWTLSFEKQEMTDFISMTNGLDPAMRLGIPIKISLPSETRAQHLLHMFKSRETHDPYDPHKKVTLTIHVPLEPDTVYMQSDSRLHEHGRMTTFGWTVGQIRDIAVRPSLETLVHDYFFRQTLQTSTHTVSRSVGGASRHENISLCSIFYTPNVNIQEKLDFITRRNGVWIKVGRWSESQSPGLTPGHRRDGEELVIVAVVPTSLDRALFLDRQVVRMYKEPSYFPRKGELYPVSSGGSNASSTSSGSSKKENSAWLRAYEMGAGMYFKA